MTHFTAHLTDSPLNREVIRHTRLSIEGERQPPYEVEVFHKDGSIHRLEVTEVPAFDELGEVVLVEGIAHDITGRVWAEQALRESENTTKALFNAPTDSAILLDRTGTILALNETASRRFGKPSSELLGITIFDLFPSYVADLRRAKFLRVLESGKPLRFEDEREGRFYDNNFYPILDRQGNVQRIAIYARDVSDYKQAVARLNERTAELIESEEKYRTLVENLPLVVYRMGPDGRILFANHFVEELFGYIRMSSVDPNLMVERAVSAVQAEIRERNVRLDLRLAPVLSRVSADSPIMEQALKALIGNALNQMPEGSVLSLSAFQEGNAYKLLMHYPVEHMGADDVEHFFYPFTPSRVVYDTNDLPLSRIIIDKHGGGIEVTMKEPGELVIRISLPVLPPLS